MWWLAMVVATAVVGQEYATRGINHGDTGSLVGGAALLGQLVWILGLLPFLLLLPLLFPDGSPATPRSRLLAWIDVAFVGLSVIFLFIGQATVASSQDALRVANPLYLRIFDTMPSFDPVLNTGTPLLFAAGVLSLLLRFRRSRGVERQQIKWVAFGVLAAFFALFFQDAIKDPTLNTIAFDLTLMIFPVTIGISVLRFRLYDLDVVVKKTLLYVTLAVFATLVYLVAVVALGSWLGRGDSVLTLVAAVIVAVTFQPMRTRLTRFADRVVYGRRATPYEVLAELGERLGDTYDVEDVLPRIARALGEAVGADDATVWLRVDGSDRPVATWSRTPDGPRQPDAYRAEVSHRGDPLGALSVSMPANDPMTPAKSRLVDDLAGQTGLVLSNVRLTEALRARLEDLRAAQKRLVTAQDQERRRLERNIHDGAQQQLVALQVRQRLAEQMIERDPEGAKRLLADLQADTATALEDLRDLARGIYPPLLADKGLAAALGAQARKSPVPATVEAVGVERFSENIEAAAYFSCLEAMQNVAKYARANAVSIRLWREEGRLLFSVADDGEGFDPTSIGYGTGLQGIADRLGALDGTLSVVSAPGAGTTISGSLPVVARDARVPSGTDEQEAPGESAPSSAEQITTAARRSG